MKEVEIKFQRDPFRRFDGGACYHIYNQRFGQSAVVDQDNQTASGSLTLGSAQNFSGVTCK